MTPRRSRPKRIRPAAVAVVAGAVVLVGASTVPPEVPRGDPACDAERPLAGHDSVTRRFARYTPSRSGFAVSFGNEVSPFRLMSAFVLPGTETEIEALLTGRDTAFEATTFGGTLTRLGPQRWTWKAPAEPGIHLVNICDLDTAETASVRFFVLAPYHGSKVFHGYRIGSYRKVPLHDDPAYAVPTGMVRVTEEDLDTWVSPHFQLRQFVCKQKGPFPKYLVMHSRMLLKLEMLLEQLNDRGIAATSFAVLSGYRTPAYNAAIGNRTTYSRHCYGDAADIYVDDDRDGVMDDLDGDGRITRADAVVLARVVEASRDEPWYAPLVGGLGVYGARPNHGPFIHVDTRGTPARW